ncbi:hypothetical protein ONZ45_g1288 [Pleurotus djamor]|nr:hypothetical protein ONZ45_g1288 [Pleurotus djamor]
MTTTAEAPCDSPPKFKPNVIDLVSTTHSSISNVNLYPGRAEVTRVFNLALKQGVNQVKISALPTILDRSSLRIEGRGAATIHDVTVAPAPNDTKPATSELLQSLSKEEKRVEQAIVRCKSAATSLEKYFNALAPGTVAIADLSSQMETLERENAKIDERLFGLEAQLSDIKTKIEEEEERVNALSFVVPELNLVATLVVFAEEEGDAEIALIYAVPEANWEARYDIRVVMLAKEKPVSLIYKAAISQSTGEAWDNVKLCLETVTPTFGVGLPELPSCRLSVYQPPPPPPPVARFAEVQMMSAPAVGMAAPLGRMRMRESARKVTMSHAMMEVSNFGGLSTSYEVPGLISIPSDREKHNVTIAELQLNATFSWITIPRVDTRVHLKAYVKNDSPYTLLAGEGSVYVDGSFISKSNLPAVSPQEGFDCPLGLDPAVRVTYHPISQKTSTSGLYNKSTVKAFTQRISVANTKPTPIENLKIVDRVPISEDSQINVKLISPTLSSLSASSTGETGTTKNRASKLLSSSSKIDEGVVAQWDGASDESVDPSTLGKDGKLNWICNIPPQGKIDVVLKWEESAPANVQVVSS